jgi:hypothetical protein
LFLPSLPNEYVFVGFEFLTALIIRVVAVLLVSCLHYSSTLVMDLTHSLETLVNVYQTMCHYSPDHTFQVCFWRQYSFNLFSLDFCFYADCVRAMGFECSEGCIAHLD